MRKDTCDGFSWRPGRQGWVSRRLVRVGILLGLTTYVAPIVIAFMQVAAAPEPPLTRLAESRPLAPLPQSASLPAPPLVPATLPATEAAPAIPSRDPAAIRVALPADAPPPFSDTERHCLARAVYYEARGEPIEGQIAVAQVVMNRMHSGKWPNTICGVVYQGIERGHKCQFSFACQDRFQPAREEQRWRMAEWLADDVAAGRAWLRELASATHFHAAGVQPIWRHNLRLIRRIGAHIFYAVPDAAPPDMRYAPVVAAAAATGEAPALVFAAADAAGSGGGASAMRVPALALRANASVAAQVLARKTRPPLAARTARARPAGTATARQATGWNPGMPVRQAN